MTEVPEDDQSRREDVGARDPVAGDVARELEPDLDPQDDAERPREAERARDAGYET